MNLKELIASTSKVKKNRDQASVFQKKFGSIYAYNKNITIARGGNAIVVNMIIGGVTDMIRTGGKRTPVPFHKVSLALNVGKDGKKEYTSKEMVDTIRAMHREYADEKKWPAPDVLKKVLEEPDKFFEDATVFPATNKGVGFVVVTNNIPEESEVQVWCSCSDYYWTFQYYNLSTKNKDGSCLNLYGASGYSSRVYVHRSKTGKNSKRPLRNPGRHPGMCKHLMLLAAMLMEDEVISDPKNGLKKYYKANYKEFLQGKEKKLVSQRTMERKMSQYERGQEVLNDQRKEAQQILGNKIERKFDVKNQTLNIKNESRDGGSSFNPLTGQRTFKNRGNFNPNTGTHNFPKNKKRR